MFPISALKPGWETSRELEVFEGALPFVAEVWSPSTGEYDQASKLPEYMARGDLEIWLVHPYDQTIAAWRRQESGEYVRTLHREGIVTIASLPGVTINMAELFR